MTKVIIQIPKECLWRWTPKGMRNDVPSDAPGLYMMREDAERLVLQAFDQGRHQGVDQTLTALVEVKPDV